MASRNGVGSRSDLAGWQWLRYYRHYASSLGSDDVLLKIDDDIVHIEDLHALISYTQTYRPQGWVYPSIVNNDIAAKWQMRDGSLQPDAYDLEHVPAFAFVWARRHEAGFAGGTAAPFTEPGAICRAPTSAELTTFRTTHAADVRPPKRLCRPTSWNAQWSQDPNAALRALAHWLLDPLALPCAALHVWSRPTRVSINLFAGIGAHVREVFTEIVSMGAGEHGEFPLDDEPVLSFTIPHRRRFLSHAVMATTAVHLHFGAQSHEVGASQALELVEAWQALRLLRNASMALNARVLWLPARWRRPWGKLMLHLEHFPAHLRASST